MKEINFPSLSFSAFHSALFSFSVLITERLNEKEAETYGGFPFAFERVFKIAIGFDAQGVQVAINGKFYCEYPYKARLATFSGVKIREKNDMLLHVLELHHRTIDKSLPNFEQLSEL